MFGFSRYIFEHFQADGDYDNTITIAAILARQKINYKNYQIQN